MVVVVTEKVKVLSKIDDEFGNRKDHDQKNQS